MAMAASAMLAGVEVQARADTRWFSASGCVRETGDRFEVFVGGSLIGVFERGDVVMRNLILLGLASDPKIHLHRLAEAFGISFQTLRRVRLRFQSGGAAGLQPKRGGKPTKQTPTLKRKLFRLFEAGATIDGAFEAIGKRVSRTLVGRIRQQWARQRASQQPTVTVQPEAMPDPTDATSVTDQDQALLVLADEAANELRFDARGEQPDALAETVGAGSTSSTAEGVSPTAIEPAAEATRREMSVDEAVERGGSYIQHIGAWLMLGLLNLIGIYRRAEQHRPRNVNRVSLRVALDAVLIALVLRQRCVEGVRRVSTPSAPVLLRNKTAPSASWVRRVLGKFADRAAVMFHLGTSVDLIRDAARGEQRRAFFYVDNHLRPYSGKFTIRKGWRMQDKRVRPGVSDYYVHDEDGRPLLRVDVPSHGSLVQQLLPIGRFLKQAVGDDTIVTLVFDRAGAFGKSMAELRDEGFEFITYERAPYQVLAASEFDQEITVGGDGSADAVRIAFAEQRKNLRFGRGRLRRIAMRMPDDAQVNIVGHSSAQATELIIAMLARWARQENQFKHEVERWGINQIDSYKLESCPPDTIIPNPARRRLDRALRIARSAEGEALRKLAHLTADDPQRQTIEQEVKRLVELQSKLDAQRPAVPKRAPLSETELSGKLLQHPGRYKTVLDALRIGLANAESELASMLAPLLPKEDEAKKTLANLLIAPGRVRLTRRHIHVALAPAATRAELAAFEVFLGQVNSMGLALPGDPSGRVLRFELDI
jgi:hypothetical protein